MKDHCKNPMKTSYRPIPNIAKSLLILILIHLVASPLGIAAESLYRYFGEQDGLLVLDPQGRPVFSLHADRPLVPASTLKLVTSLTALELLGPGYRFKTEVYLTPENDIILKGYGDPLLVSEVMADLSAKTSNALSPQKKLRRLLVDDTAVSPVLAIPGRSDTDNPYDAPNGALCANFNTVSFESDRTGRFYSAEPQTPLVPYALDRIRASGRTSGRIVFSHDMHDASLYAGHLFSHFLSDQGILFSQGVTHGVVDKNRHKCIVSYDSPYPLTTVIERLLEYSNNFIANQLLLAMGATKNGGVATLEKGVKTVQEHIDHIFGPGRIQIFEGSGLSRKNRIRAEDLCRCLERLAPYRNLLRSEGREFYKTGTLDGVRARAGYIEGKNGGFYRYALLLNTPGKNPDPIMRELMQRLN
jgi:serine-type D-Ala-D-Ala carboxypeptidase/endopeptidase (penicillin-binding protein 4)